MSDEREPNNRSDAALRERLELAGKAAKGPWKSDVIPPEMVGARPRYVIRDGKGIVIVEDVHHFASWQKTGLHIVASSPDVVRADIEEILRLRAEVARLNKEADWLVGMLSHYTEDCPLKFSWVYEEIFPIPKIDGCDGSWPDDDYFDCTNSTPEKCWREAARKAVEEEND